MTHRALSTISISLFSWKKLWTHYSYKIYEHTNLIVYYRSVYILWMLQFMDHRSGHSEQKKTKMATINLWLNKSDFMWASIFLTYTLLLFISTQSDNYGFKWTHKTYAFLFQWVISRPLLPWKQWSPKTGPDPIGTGFCQL